MDEIRYRKGDVVRFRFGNRFVQGVVREDRGPIGVKGRRLYSVDFFLDSLGETPSVIELPAVDLQLAADSGKSKVGK